MDETNKLQIESKTAHIDNLKRELGDIEAQQPFVEDKISVLDREAKILDDRADIILNNYEFLGEKKWMFEELDAYKELQKQIEQLGFDKQKIQLNEQKFALNSNLIRFKEQKESLDKELVRLTTELEALMKGE